jgi:hypothetical protein
VLVEEERITASGVEIGRATLVMRCGERDQPG